MKFIALILTFVLAFSFVACNESGEQSLDDSSVTASTPAEQSNGKESEVVSEDASEAVSETVSEEASEEVSETVSDDPSEEVSEESGEPEEPTEIVYDDVSIGKASTAPVVDGEVGKDEYTTEIKFDMDSSFWGSGSTESAENYDVILYLSWDENYLYSAVSVKVGMPRTYNNTNFTQERPYIFDRRHVMTALVLGDPDDPKYMAPDGKEWDWGAAYNSGLANEWTVTAQPDGSNICTDHFGNLTTNYDFEYVVGVSKHDDEIYEQAIPWKALAHGAEFKAEAGSIFGYAFTCCCEEVDISVDIDPDAIYACFGNGILSYKNFADYVAITLAE